MAKRITEDEPFIDEEFVERVNWVVDDVLLHDETFKAWEHDIDKQESMHLSELKRIFMNFTKTDFAAAVYTAMENWPYMVFQIAAEWSVRNHKEGENNG